MSKEIQLGLMGIATQLRPMGKAIQLGLLDKANLNTL
jgi:hypothetical protein